MCVLSTTREVLDVVLESMDEDVLDAPIGRSIGDNGVEIKEQYRREFADRYRFQGSRKAQELEKEESSVADGDVPGIPVILS